MNKVVWSFLLVLFLCSYNSAETGGTIKGAVVDESGEPIQRAEVHIAENKKFTGHRLIRMYETNATGQFVIENVPWGAYVVMAGKESAGYPDTKLAFYSNLVVPTVTLTPEFPSATVNVQLGPKAGILEIESLRDVVTGKPLSYATITLRRVKNPNLFILTATTEGAHILVPSLTDVDVEVSAPGYRKEMETKSTQIRLKSEEIYKLRLSLQPETSPSQD